MRRPRRTLTLLALALLAVTTARPAHVSPGERATLRVALISDGANYAPFYLAEPAFLEEGLDVQVVHLATGPATAAAIASGSVDVAVMSLEPVVYLILAGHDVRVFYAPRVAVGFAWMARPGIAGWADLRGRSVGISSFGSFTEGVTRVILQRRGLVPGRDVNLTALGGGGTRLAALRAGRVDAAILTAPHTYAARAMGFSVLATQAAEFGEIWPQSLFTARTRVLAERADDLRRFLRGYVRGVRRARADGSASVGLLMTRLKLARADAEPLWAEVLPTVTEQGDLSPRGMAAFWDVMTALGEVSGPWPEERFLDRRFIDSFESWAPPR